MHLTDHVTDAQLNEYLDDESSERAQIESHLAECTECAARLAALQALFDEIESLPELELTRPLAAAFTRPSSLPAQLPRWITLTATLQAVLALIAMFFAVPILSKYLAPVLQVIPVPSFSAVLIEIQMYFMTWMQAVRSFQLPTIPAETFTLLEELSPATLSIGLLCISLIWLIGNWWLLRNRPNPLA